MLLKSLHLKNIRSYNDENITFPNGIVLLAGDIGAGKSTILLAIEFALFGILRGELSGSALLRHGAREGTVELAFELEGKQYTIGRTLKRTKTSVEQAAGYLIENELRQDLTAIELKSRVLGLLGYPSDLVTKSKSLIYRYTVYTPQEDMKRIILEDTENRLMILRKVFDIDKYRRISDNAAMYAKLLRERKRTFEGQLSDEQLKKQQFAAKKKEAETVQKSSLDIQPRLNTAKQAVVQQQTVLEQVEKERTKLTEHKATLDSAERELKTLAQAQQHAQTELNQLAKLQEMPKPTATPKEIEQNILTRQKELQEKEQSLRVHVAARADLLATKRISDETIQKIRTLDQCPTCLQNVADTHKHSIMHQESTKADKLLEQVAHTEQSISKQEQAKKSIQQEIDAFQKQNSALRESQVKHEHYCKELERKKNAETRLAELTQTINAAETRKKQATNALQANTAIETRHTAEKEKLKTLQQQEKTVMIEHATLLERAKLLKETLLLLEQELKKKQQAREQLEKLSAMHQWVNEFFTNTMTVMEKHVMTKIYHEFNSLFVNWFNGLIEDEVLQARLDETFSPIMQQNGYDTVVENLSGGEKTACALAYRLALNKVITALRSSVHTKDLLILDEPTDGFSSDQIDKMRDVLDQLQARQIIIVSHEAKIESLADHVVRIVKEEHASKALV